MKAPKSKEPWNKGRLAGQKAPLKLKEIWAIRIRLQLAEINPAVRSHCRKLGGFNRPGCGRIWNVTCYPI